jgi:hypothetical protein
MSKTKIFISSTCYDLSQVRDDIRNSILGIGHTPYLSDYPSFPIIPDLTNLENCKRNVRENTDIFILVIGGRYGSLDITSNKSITNLEYESAKQYGIESFIFVNDTILSILPIWEKNPDADFSSYVDSVEVFKFIQGIKNEQKWIFTFNKASEIVNTIKDQLSVYLMYLIDKKRGNKIEPLPEFSNESVRARQIALDKPAYWEFLLTDELLRTKLNSVSKKFNDLNNGLIFKKHISVSGIDFLNTKFKDMICLLSLFGAAAKKMEKSWGELGTAGDAIEIKEAVETIISGCNSLFDWELNLKYELPPEKFINLQNLLQGCSFELFQQIEELPNKLMEPFKEPNPKGTFEIYMKIDAPSRMDEINMEINRLNRML